MAAGSLARPHAPSQVSLSRHRGPVSHLSLFTRPRGRLWRSRDRAPRLSDPSPGLLNLTHRSVSRRSRNFGQRAVAEASC